MKRALPPNVYEKAPGRLYFFKRPGPWVRLRSEPFSSDWYAEIARAAENKPILTDRTFKALIASYMQSPRWMKLKPRSKTQYGYCIKRLEKIGHLPVEEMRRVDVIRIRDNATGTPANTNFLLAVLKAILEHAIDIGWIEQNPAHGVTELKYDKRKRKPWPPELVEAFRQAAGPRGRLVFELCIGTGQRIGDVLKMQWKDVKNGGIEVKQSKTGKELFIPLTRQLKSALDATERRPGYIVGRKTGAPGPLSYTPVFREIMAVRRQIGAEAYDIHSLRHTTATELVEAGCGDELIAAVTGHETLAQVKRYTESARQKVRAIKAQEKRK